MSRSVIPAELLPPFRVSIASLPDENADSELAMVSKWGDVDIAVADLMQPGVCCDAVERL
jgi:hypothetical protein